MLAEAIVFLVMLIPNTDQPVIVLMQAYQSARECNTVLKQVPADQRDKWACIKIDLKPPSEPVKGREA